MSNFTEKALQMQALLTSVTGLEWTQVLENGPMGPFPMLVARPPEGTAASVQLLLNRAASNGAETPEEYFLVSTRGEVGINPETTPLEVVQRAAGGYRAEYQRTFAASDLLDILNRHAEASWRRVERVGTSGAKLITDSLHNPFSAHQLAAELNRAVRRSAADSRTFFHASMNQVSVDAAEMLPEDIQRLADNLSRQKGGRGGR